MITLPTCFRSGGFDFKQLAREGDVALFRKSKLYKHVKPPLNFETYEVIIVQKMEEHEWPNGDLTPAHEHVPGDAQWGTCGWSLQTLERAWEKVKEVARE